MSFNNSNIKLCEFLFERYRAMFLIAESNRRFPDRAKAKLAI